ASGDAAGASNGAARRGLGQGRAAAATDAASDRRASAVDTGRDAALRAGVDASFHAALSSAGEANDPRSAAPSREHAIDALTASLAAGAANRMAEQSPGTTATVALALSTPIDAPDFAATLGVQVSVLAQDGVQQAELHLNPAEMGPVSIHISLDGTAARVDFGADVAATRQAIERGLPELASALRDAGFTLAGGGVSSHAGGRPNGEDDAARATHRSDGGDSLTGATSIAASVGTVVRSVGTGGVDLYA
ncbi:MAG TPA: flagellar hook-length control protein FliK, partial [Caldimonas sp.]|nr:flagellar hook-length control protein FliK [Caldimonas sp.]